jgi:hypothetical protein
MVGTLHAINDMLQIRDIDVTDSDGYTWVPDPTN